MANEQTSDLQVLGVGHLRTNIWFSPNGVLDPVAFGGAYVSSIIRTGVGAYLVTLTGFSPRALISAEGYAFDNAAPTNSDARVGQVVITPATKTATVAAFINTTLAGPAFKDVAADANSVVKIGLTWKVLAGSDGSGL